MTGMELVKDELRQLGYNPSKINANIKLIEDVITILSDEETRAAIDLADVKLREAKAIAEETQISLTKAMDERLGAEKRKAMAEESLLKAERVKESTRQMRDEIHAALQMETAEARDRARLLTQFKMNLPDVTDKDNRAIIYAMGAILSGQPLAFSGGGNCEGK